MPKTADKIMTRARKLFEASGLSLEEVGKRMGYRGDTSRKAAWQFLNKTTDPRLSMLIRYAEAMNVPLVDLMK